jgi:hypothetical protein
MKFTQWHDGDVKPVHEGVYQTGGKGLPVFYSFWNGKRWNYCELTIEKAIFYQNHESPTKQEPWRGLAVKP